MRHPVWMNHMLFEGQMMHLVFNNPNPHLMSLKIKYLRHTNLLDTAPVPVAVPSPRIQVQISIGAVDRKNSNRAHRWIIVHSALDFLASNTQNRYLIPWSRIINYWDLHASCNLHRRCIKLNNLLLFFCVHDAITLTVWADQRMHYAFDVVLKSVL